MERYRFHNDGALFYVTFTVVEWLPVFVSEAACGIIADSFNFCHHNKGLRINAYVVMPTHLHAIVFHESFKPEPLVSVLTDFRKFTGRQIADYAQVHMPGCMTDVFLENAGEDRERRVWQPSRHPVQIETQKFWQTKCDYLHDNPVRKGLVARPQHWRFSSAAYWYPLDSASHAPVNDVVLTPIGW